MTRVVVRDQVGQRMIGSAGLQLSEYLRDITDFLTERSGRFRPYGVVPQQVAVFLQAGSASGGINNDGLHIRTREGLNKVARACQRSLLFAGVELQSAATA